MELSIYDYIVFSAVLVISACIGIYYRFTGGKQKTTHEYFLANGSMSPYPVAFSLMASFMSAISLLGMSSEYYLHGTQFAILNVGNILVTPIAIYVFLPVLYQLKVPSVYQYLQLRFGRRIRILASLAFSFQMILYMGIVLYAPSLAISAVTQLDTTISVLSIGLVCTFYSCVGGIKAVLVTDVFQGCLMFVALYCVIIKGAIDSNGLGNIFTIASEGNRIEFFNFIPDPTERHSVFALVIGGGFMYLAVYAVNQAQVQRMMTVKTLKNAQYSSCVSLVLLTFLSLSGGLAGLTIYARYHKCDPLLSSRICSADQLLPLFVADTFEDIPGLTGLFIAGLLSGSLSTISSGINSLAAVTWEDYISPLMKTTPSQWIIIILNKGLAVLFGLACIGIAFIAANFQSIMNWALSIFGIIGGPLLGLFTLGMIFPFVSETATIPSFVLAIAFGLWLGFGGPKPPVGRLNGDLSECDVMNIISDSSCIVSNGTAATQQAETEYFYLYRISYLWYTAIGFSITVLISCALSLRFPQKEKVPLNLLSPVLHRIIKFGCGINHNIDSFQSCN